jgi:predicted phosphoribosyltransferase
MFEDRTDAGRRLAKELAHYAGREDVIILALPRGGIPVGFEVAKALNAPMDVFLVRKLGTPGQRELAMGAIASGGVRVLNDELIRYLGIPSREIEQAAARETEELKRRELIYRGGRAMPDMRGRCAVLVDDGLATGSTMRAAVAALSRLEPSRIVVAVPVAAPDTCAAFTSEVDEILCLETPRHFDSVGAWYDEFSQTTDDEVKEYMELAGKQLPPLNITYPL